MIYSSPLLHHLRRTIGQNIHSLRVRRKIPLWKLSRLTGVSERMLDQYELGKHDIRLEAVLRIACALDVPVGALMQDNSRKVGIHAGW